MVCWYHRHRAVFATSGSGKLLRGSADRQYEVTPGLLHGRVAAARDARHQGLIDVSIQQRQCERFRASSILCAKARQRSQIKGVFKAENPPVNQPQHGAGRRRLVEFGTGQCKDRSLRSARLCCSLGISRLRLRVHDAGCATLADRNGLRLAYLKDPSHAALSLHTRYFTPGKRYTIV